MAPSWIALEHCVMIHGKVAKAYNMDEVPSDSQQSVYGKIDRADGQVTLEGLKEEGSSDGTEMI